VPDLAIHVGDTPAADVAGAVAAGIRPVLIDPLDAHANLPHARAHSLSDVVELVKNLNASA
jgi:FMN phosphatase YigB (HAD superfamily)